MCYVSCLCWLSIHFKYQISDDYGWLRIHAVYFHIFVSLTPWWKTTRSEIKLKMFPNLMTLWFAFFHAVIFVHANEKFRFIFLWIILFKSINDSSMSMCVYFWFLFDDMPYFIIPAFQSSFFVLFRFHDQTAEFNINEYHLFLLWLIRI